ncbi:hypothetical protein QJQ45_025088, partial [Haematococcus lacustris]
MIQGMGSGSHELVVLQLNLMTEVGDHNRTVWRQFWEMEAATVGGAVRKCGERLFRHVETSQGTKDVTNQFVVYCKVKGIIVPKDPQADYAFKQFVKREFEAASKSLGAPALRTAIGNPVGSLAFLVACAAGFDKDSVVDHQLKEGLAGKPVMPLLLVDHMAFTSFKLYYRLTDLYRQVTGEKEPYKELMASNHNALMLQFREVLLKECKAFGWENIDNVRVCGMQAWQVVGGWYRFKAAQNKRAAKQDIFEALNQVHRQWGNPGDRRVSASSKNHRALKKAAASGQRPEGPEYGAGCRGSDQGHVLAGWPGLSADAKAQLLEDLVGCALLLWTSPVKRLREGRVSWASLSPGEQWQLLHWLDGLPLGKLVQSVKEQEELLQLSEAWVWE